MCIVSFTNCVIVLIVTVIVYTLLSILGYTVLYTKQNIGFVCQWICCVCMFVCI